MPRYPRKDVQNDAIKLIGEICHRARKNQGITLKEMSEKTQYSTDTLKQFERGKSNNMLIFIIYVNSCTDFNWSNIIKYRRL